MVDLNKIIRLIKSGNCFYDSFNLRIKKANDFEEEGDEAARWLAEQERATPVPSDIPVSQSIKTISPQVISNEIEDAMNMWIKSNSREIEEENQNDITTLQVKKDQSPSDSYISPDPRLYNEIINNPSLHQVLVDKIKDQTFVSDTRKANLFVETMMEKTRSLREDIEYREMEISREEEQKKLEQEKRMQEKMQDPYFVATPLPDPRIDIKAYERFINLSQEEKTNIYDIIHMKYNNEMLSKAIEAKLSTPKDDKHIDQRMNFFLRFPQYLQSVMDPQLENILKEELPKMGIVEDDVFTGISQAYSTRAAKKRTCNILNNIKGPELYNILLDLIDKADPVIMEWLKGSLFIDIQMTAPSYSQPIGTEGETMEQNLSGMTSKDVGELQLNAADKKEASDVFSAISKGFLMPTLMKADDIRKNAIGAMISDSINEYRLAEAGEVEDSVNAKKNAEKKYKVAEQINAFTIPIVGQFKNLLTERGEALRPNPETMMYKNKHGKMHIPNSVLKDIYRKEKEGDPSIDRFDHKSLVERYIRRIGKGDAKNFVPNWGSMVNYNFPVNSFKEMGKLKAKIKELAKQNIDKVHQGNTDIISEHLIGSDYNPMLNKFASVYDSDSQSDKMEKIHNFIYMTLTQDNEYIKWLQELGSQVVGKKSFALNNVAYHQLKSIIGGKYTPLLGYLINQKEAPQNIVAKMQADPNYEPSKEDIKIMNDSENYTSGTLHALISLLDHHSNVKQFMRDGRMPNPIDEKHRTNTELYYTLKEETPPPHIQELFNLYNEGISKSQKTYKGQPSLQQGSWYQTFFGEYDKFDRLSREKEKKEARIEEIRAEKKNYYQYINSKIVRIINDPKKYAKLLKNIQDEQEKIDFDAEIKNWDKISPLSPKIYTLFGQRTTANRLSKMDSKIKEIEEGSIGKKVKSIDFINKQIEEVKRTLSQILEQSGYQPLNPSALRLANETYKRYLIKIAALEKMKKFNIKVAAVNYIDAEINRIKTNFNNYFNSLFSW